MPEQDTTETTPEAKPATPCSCFAEFQYQVEPEDGTDEEFPVYGQCGRTTRNEFAQGHDAKLKSVLIQCFRAGVDYAYIDGSILNRVDPMEVAKQRGWEHLITPAKPKKERKPKAAKADAAPEEKLDLLALMKQAAVELKARGQYGNRSKHRIVITAENAQSIVDGTHPDLVDVKYKK